MNQEQMHPFIEHQQLTAFEAAFGPRETWPEAIESAFSCLDSGLDFAKNLTCVIGSIENREIFEVPTEPVQITYYTEEEVERKLQKLIDRGAPGNPEDYRLALKSIPTNLMQVNCARFRELSRSLLVSRAEAFVAERQESEREVNSLAS